MCNFIKKKKKENTIIFSQKIKSYQHFCSVFYITLWSIFVVKCHISIEFIETTGKNSGFCFPVQNVIYKRMISIETLVHWHCKRYRNHTLKSKHFDFFVVVVVMVNHKLVIVIAIRELEVRNIKILLREI